MLSVEKIYGVFDYILYFPEGTTIFYGYINQKNIVYIIIVDLTMIIIIPTIKYGSYYNTYNTFTMVVCSNYHGYFSQCIIEVEPYNVLLNVWVYMDH